MRELFKKVVSVIASAVMLGSTIGIAAAANYPSPFVEGGSADGAIVVTSGAHAMAASDLRAAIDLSQNLNNLVTTTTTTTTAVSGTAWQVATSSDKLELGESVKNVQNYITDEEIPILADGTASNEKGTAKYNQFLYFEDAQTGGVNYTQDSDTDAIGLFYYIKSGKQIARYVMDFTADLKSDVIAGSHADDIEDIELNFLGKPYTVITAINKTSTATDCDEELILMSGANKGTVKNDEEITIGGKTVSVIVSSATKAQFTVDGEQSNKLNEGETFRLKDSSFLGVTDITYQDYAGGIQQATFYLGADKIELKNGSTMIVNADTISDAAVEIECTMASGDIDISEIKVNMSSGDEYFVPVNGKLSGAIKTAGEDAKVLVTQNWDIEFKGLATYKTEPLKITTTSSDERLEITFNNYDGKTITLPVFFINKTPAGIVEGIYSGEKPGSRLLLGTSNGTSTNTSRNMTKDDLFVLHTANPKSAANNARTYVIQYKGHDKSTDTSPQVRIRVLGETSDREISLTTTAASGATAWSVRLGGTTFNFFNKTSMKTKDQPFFLTTNDYSSARGATSNGTRDLYLRTQYNALINITEGGQAENVSCANTGALITPCQGAWTINVSVDDTNKDGDTLNLATKQQIVWINYTNETDQTSAKVNSKTVKTTTSWQTNDSNTDMKTYMTTYGAYIEDVDTSTAPAQFKINIPESIVEPLVYVSSGAISVTPGKTAGGQVLVVKDTEIDSVKDKHLIVVGGSCVNSVARKIIDPAATAAICAEAFSAKTNVGVGQYILQSVASPYNANKIAMLVAGYEAADTVSAVSKLKESHATTAGTKNIYPVATA